MSGDVGGTTSGDDRMTDATFAALLEEAEQACSLMDDSVVRRMRSGDRAQGMAPFEVLRVMLSRLVEAVRAREAERAAALASAPDVLRDLALHSGIRLEYAESDAIEALVADHARLRVEVERPGRAR